MSNAALYVIEMTTRAIYALVATDKVANLHNNFQLLGELIGQRCWYFLSCPMLHTSSRHSTHFKDHLLSLIPE